MSLPYPDETRDVARSSTLANVNPVVHCWYKLHQHKLVALNGLESIPFCAKPVCYLGQGVKSLQKAWLRKDQQDVLARQIKYWYCPVEMPIKKSKTKHFSCVGVVDIHSTPILLWWFWPERARRISHSRWCRRDSRAATPLLSVPHSYIP